MRTLLWFRKRGFLFWFLFLGGAISVIGLVGMFTAIAEGQGLISFDFLRAKPDLSLTLSATPQTTEKDGDLTYTIRVTNNGKGEAKRIVVNTTLPEGVSFTSSEPGDPACFESERVVNCRLGALETGEQIEVVVVVKVKAAAPETLVAAATVETSTDDSNLSDNSVTVSTAVK
jgi:uncharacterized repeat protein (TIGR01451 family)